MEPHRLGDQPWPLKRRSTTRHRSKIRGYQSRQRLRPSIDKFGHAVGMRPQETFIGLVAPRWKKIGRFAVG